MKLSPVRYLILFCLLFYFLGKAGLTMLSIYDIKQSSRELQSSPTEASKETELSKEVELKELFYHEGYSFAFSGLTDHRSERHYPINSRLVSLYFSKVPSPPPDYPAL